MYLAIGDSLATFVLSGAGGAVIGCTYFPATPTRQADGGGFEEVTESGELVLMGTAAQIRTAVNTIETYFEQAFERQIGGRGDRVYASYMPVGGDVTYRSEILEGRVTWSENPALRRLKDTNPIVRVGFAWRRRPYWEGPEAEVQLATSNQSYGTGGRTIYNHDDSGTGHDNWVQVNPASVTGVLPAGTRIHVINTAGAARTWRRLWVALNAAYTFSHVIEAETRLAGGSVLSSGAASNGQYVQVTLSNASLTLSWTLSSSLLSAGLGRFLRLLAIFNQVSILATAVVRAQISDATGNVLWMGDAAATPTSPGILDLGAIPIPPGGRALLTPGTLTLQIVITGTGTWGLDFLQITPTNGLAIVEGLAPVANNAAVVLNSIERRGYVADSSNNQYPYVAVSGQPIELAPNIVQQLIVLAETTSGVEIADTCSVRVWVRPRRLVV